MSRTAALKRARNLREELLAQGVKVSIELQTGRSGGWNAGRYVGCLGHHTVSRRSMGDTPVLGLVKRGRSDLPGPLANGYGGFDEVARLITMDWANHPGLGGPLAVPGLIIPANNGRPYLFGWEHEGGLSQADWTASFREFMGRCHAATLLWLKRDQRSYGEHKTWAPTRKIDRLGYSTASGRREAARYLSGGGGTEEDDMYAVTKDSPVWLIKEWQKVLNWWADRKGLTRARLDVDGAWGPATDGMWKAVAQATSVTVFEAGKVLNASYTKLWHAYEHRGAAEAEPA